ncbi:glycosyltransferase family 2 protein [Halorubrum distributum]|uniref:glycosyltransferase n=1 Tax=Halorubrum distributum TaxID=29283 RepID=UPI0029535A83|nr:glycosyltransferase family 2 protein [Halorubrum distributum]MDV7348165.1 glycosyltransferase family 2 protein [Halorubrum distributum]
MSEAKTDNPYISVVIPAYNEEQIIEQSLKSILSQKTSFQYEVVVVNDNSTDNTPDILESYSEKHGKLCILNNEKNRGIVPTFNRGCKHAKGEIICMTGADTLLDEGYLDNVSKHTKRGADLVLGYVKVRNSEYFHPLVAQISKEKSEEYRYGGAAMSVRRNLFIETGGFLGDGGDVHQGEAQELIKRAERLGWDIVKDSSIIAYSEFPTGLKEIFQRKLWAGYMYMNYSYEHPSEICLVRRLAGGAFFGVTTALIILTTVIPKLSLISVPLVCLFLYDTYDSAVEMYEKSGKLHYFLLRFLYDYLAGNLRLIGYTMAWRKVLGIGIKKARSNHCEQS